MDSAVGDWVGLRDRWLCEWAVWLHMCLFQSTTSIIDLQESWTAAVLAMVCSCFCVGSVAIGEPKGFMLIAHFIVLTLKAEPPQSSLSYQQSTTIIIRSDVRLNGQQSS